jgi:ankyrin repeat protein
MTIPWLNFCYFKLGNTALHFASDGGHLEIVTLLLDQRADVNVQDEVKEGGS